jgi:hypothetical protein
MYIPENDCTERHSNRREQLLTQSILCLHLFAAMEPSLSQLPAMFSYAQARAVGLSKRELYRLRDQGVIEPLSRGLYQRVNAALTEVELRELAHRAPRGTLCLTTALSRHGLTDEIPGRLDVALPRRTRPPAVSVPVQWHYFEPTTFDVGRTLLPLDDGATIGLYSPERCIVDAFRLRATQGHELAHEALKRWLRQPGNQPAALLRLSKSFPRALTPIRTALEVLL